MTLESVSPAEEKGLGDQWREAFAPRTWANTLFEDLFESGDVPTANLLLYRHGLLLLADLRRENVGQALAAVKWGNAPKFVEAGLMQMAASVNEVQINRDAADIGSLVGMIDRILASPSVEVE